MYKVTVFDLEYASDYGAKDRNWSGPKEYRELTQIGAVVVDLVNMAIVDRFHTFVNPINTWPPTRHHLELTGTKIEDYANAPEPPIAIEQFFRFAQGAPAFCYGEDGRVLLENLVLHNMAYSTKNARGLNIRGNLSKNSRCKIDQDICMAFYGDEAKKAHKLSGGEYRFTVESHLHRQQIALSVVDVLPSFKKAGIDTDIVSSGDLAGTLGLPVDGKTHSPIWDSTSVVRAATHLMNTGSIDIFRDAINISDGFNPLRPFRCSQAANGAGRLRLT